MNSLAVPVWRRVSIEVYCPVEFGRFNHDTAETPMTRTSMDLSGFLAKHDQSDFMHVPAGNVLHLIMEADVEGLIGAGRHERADNRTTWRTTRRNGYRESALDTRMGTLNLKVPKLDTGKSGTLRAILNGWGVWPPLSVPIDEIRGCPVAFRPLRAVSSHGFPALVQDRAVEIAGRTGQRQSRFGAAGPMVRTNRPNRFFRCARTCSTAAPTEDFPAFARALANGIDLPFGLRR